MTFFKGVPEVEQASSSSHQHQDPHSINTAINDVINNVVSSTTGASSTQELDIEQKVMIQNNLRLYSEAIIWVFIIVCVAFLLMVVRRMFRKYRDSH